MPIFLAFALQYIAFRIKISTRVLFLLYSLLVTAALALPVWAGLILRPHPGFATNMNSFLIITTLGPMIYVFGLAIVAALKIISFAHVMGNVREVVGKVIEHDKSSSSDPMPEYLITGQVSTLLLMAICLTAPNG